MSTFIPAINGYGTIFAWSSVGSSGTFHDMANVRSISPPAFSRPTFDVTNHGTTDAAEQVIQGGIVRSGSISFTAIYLSSDTYQTVLLSSAFHTATRCGWKFNIGAASSGSVWYGDGIITGYGMTLPQEGPVEFTCSIKVIGKPTLGDST